MIIMKAGVFGLPVNGITKPMDKNSGPFRANAEQEARLVALGMAEYVPDPEAPMEQDTSKDNDDTNTVDINPVGFDETSPEDEEPVEDAEEDVVDDEADAILDLHELTAKELREIGKEYGLTFKANASKTAMIADIEAAQREDAVEDDGEPAPTFDASEAVL